MKWTPKFISADNPPKDDREVFVIAINDEDEKFFDVAFYSHCRWWGTNGFKVLKWSELPDIKEYI